MPQHHQFFADRLPRLAQRLQQAGERYRDGGMRSADQTLGRRGRANQHPVTQNKK